MKSCAAPANPSRRSSPIQARRSSARWKKGQVIATGGGAVLKSENVRAMRRNGRLLLITRPLDALSTEGRPLSASRVALIAMREARGPIYCACADVTIDNRASIEEAASTALAAFASAVER